MILPDPNYQRSLQKPYTPMLKSRCLMTGLLLFIATTGLHAAVSLDSITPSFIRHPLDSAYIVSDALKNSEEKASLLKQIAVQYAFSGDTKIAFQIGIVIQKSFPGTPAATMVFPEIGAAFAKQGQRNEAITLLNTLKDNPAKPLTAEYIALTYIQQKQLDIAQAFINDIESTAKKARLSLQLAEAYASDGFFQKSETLLKEVSGSQSKNQSLANIAILAAKNQQLARAQLLLEQVTDAEQQAQALSEVVSIGGSNQQFQESLRIANSIVAAKHRNKALAYLAGGYAKHKMFGEALSLADSLSGEAKEIAYSRIGKALGEVGELENAERLLDKIQSPDYRFDSLMGITKGHIQEGNYDKSVQLVETISDSVLREKGFILLGEFLGSTQQFHYAQLLIRQFQPEDVKNQAFAKYVSTFVRHAAVSRVLRITQEIKDTALRNDTLSSIADYYLNTGQFGPAKQVISNITSPEIQHNSYLKAAQMAQKNQNTALAQEFISSCLDNTSTFGSTTAQALALSEIVPQLVALQQQDKAKSTIEKAHDLIKSDRDWYRNKTLATAIANAFLMTDNPVLAYQIIMKLPRLEDQSRFLLQVPNTPQTAPEEKKRRAILRELARAAQLRPK